VVVKILRPFSAGADVASRIFATLTLTTNHYYYIPYTTRDAAVSLRDRWPRSNRKGSNEELSKISVAALHCSFASHSPQNKGRDKDTIDRKAELMLVEMKKVKDRETLHTYLDKTD